MLAVLFVEGDNVLMYDTDDVQSHNLQREGAEISPGEFVCGKSSFTVVFKAGKHPHWMNKNVKQVDDEGSFTRLMF